MMMDDDDDYIELQTLLFRGLNDFTYLSQEPAPPVQLVVKAGEILENGDAADDDDEDEIPTPEGATVYVVEGERKFMKMILNI